jgi:hypothetical protein
MRFIGFLRKTYSATKAHVTNALLSNKGTPSLNRECYLFVEVAGTISDTVIVRVDQITAVINIGSGCVIHLASGSEIESKIDAIALMSKIKNVYENIRQQIPECRNYLPALFLCRMKGKYQGLHKDSSEELNNRD